jgi:adenylate cyclase
MRLSPRDPAVAQWHVSLGLAELGLGNFEAAASQFHQSIDFGNRTFIPYGCMAAAYALKGDMEAAKSALAEARRFNPSFTVKRMAAAAPAIPNLLEGLRKAGLPEE